MYHELYDHSTVVSWSHTFQSIWTGSISFNKVTVEEAPSGLMVIPNSKLIQVGDTVTFTVTVSRGTHLVYMLDYGDGEFGIKEGPAAVITQTFVHRYNRPGEYVLALIVHNDVSSASEAFLDPIVVLEEVANMVWTSDEPVAVPDGRIEYIVEASDEEYPNFETPNLDYTYGDGYSDTVSSSNLTLLLPQSQIYHFSSSAENGVTSNVVATNTYGTKSLAMHQDLEDVVAGLELHIVPEIYSLMAQSNRVTFVMSVTVASHVEYLLDYGDNGNDTFSHPLIFPSYPLEFAHTYISPGIYTPTLTMSNQISSKTVGLPHNITVDNYMHMVYLSDPPSVLANPPGLAVFTVSTAFGYDPPSSVKCHWKVDDLYIETSDAFELFQMTPHQHTLHLSKIGINVVNINCSNSINYVIMTQEVNVLKKIAGVHITPDKYIASVGEEVVINITVEYGSNVQGQVKFGDGSLHDFTYPTLLAGGEDILIQHTYSINNNYTISVTCWNDVSTESVIQRTPIIIQNPIESFMVEQYTSSSVDTGIVYFTVTQTNQVFPPSQVFLHWHHADGQKETKFAPSLSNDQPFYNSHTYTSDYLGTHTLTVNGSNLISNYIHVGEFVIQEPLIVGNMVSDKVHVSVDDGIMITLDIMRGSHISFHVDLDDGSNYTFLHSNLYKHFHEQYHISPWQEVQILINTDISILANVAPTSFGMTQDEWVGRVSKLMVRHVYRKSGLYKPKVIVYNELTSHQEECDDDIAVEIPLHGGLIMKVADVIPQPPGNVELTLTLTEQPVPTAVTCVTTVNTKTKQMNINFALNLTMTDKPQKVHFVLYDWVLGHVSLVTLCHNSVSDRQMERNVFVVEEIGGLIIYTPSNVGVDREVTFFIKMVKGSDVNVRVEYGDGMVDTEFVSGQINNHEMKYTYQTTGLHNVKVVAWNNYSQSSNTTSIYVYTDLNKLDLAISGDLIISVPYKMVGRGVLFVDTVEEDTDLMSTSLEWTILKSDGSLLWSERVDENNTITVPLNEGGQYNIIVNVTNPISSSIVQQGILAMEAIVGIEITVNSTGYNTPYVDDLVYVPLNKPISFVCDTIWGNNISYHWQISDTAVAYNMSSILNYTFHSLRSHQLTLVLNNQISERSKSLTVVVMETIEFKSLKTTSLPVTTEDTIFYLNIKSFGTEACYTFDLGEGDVKFYFGSGRGCPSNLTNFISYNEEENIITIRYRYTSTGHFLFSVTAENVVSRASLIQPLVINTEKCSPPEVVIQGKGTSEDSPRVEILSDEIKIYTFTKISCQLSNIVIFTWDIYQNGDWTTLDWANKSASIFPERYFESGKHHIRITAKMFETLGTEAVDDVYLDVITSPLEVGISGGNMVTVGWNHTWYLDAWTLTFDPDVETHKSRNDLMFTWYCRYASTKLTEKTIVNETTSYKVITEDDSGCFNDADLIKSGQHSGELQLSTNHLRLDTEYYVRVEVTKGALRRGDALQTLYIVAGYPPSITIRYIVLFSQPDFT